MTDKKHKTHSLTVAWLVAALLAAGLLHGGRAMAVDVRGSVYGGGNVADVGQATKVILLAGTVRGDVYGGGKGQLQQGTVGDAGYKAPIAATVGAASVFLNGLEAADYTEAQYGTLGLQQQGEGDAAYYAVADNKRGCAVKGSIFGCNNLNGTPLGHVKVHVYATQHADSAAITKKGYNKYDVTAVYGGGNLAAYMPKGPGATATDTDYKNTTEGAEVIIDGCGRTSIRQVYGGGNAASAPATSVTVNGTYEIEEIFGGGNGKDSISKDGGNTYIVNPGANVGYEEYPTTYDPPLSSKEERTAKFAYGRGEARVNIYGGLIHRVFGGSNTKGNVRKIAVTLLDGEVEGCDFSIDEAYGGGKSAPMDGAAHLEMACIPGLKVAYGGAEEASINNDVTLNITNGTFDRVFGGNNVKGTISGKITVNIEETGCRPIIIGQLYGGGNQAPYTAANGTDGPTLNIRSFTSIGDVFGGGYGQTAVVTGDTHVNINVCKGRYADYDTDESLTGDQTLSFTQYQRTTDVTEENPDGFVFDNEGNRKTELIPNIPLYLPPHASGQIGGINRVYGGGNQAKVIGNTYVNIGTTDKEVFATPATKEVEDVKTETTDEERTNTVIGASILGNVYGGGNQADVTGRTNVVIGKQVAVSAEQDNGGEQNDGD